MYTNPLQCLRGSVIITTVFKKMIEVRSRRRTGSRRAMICLEASSAELYDRAREYGGHMVNSHMTVCRIRQGRYSYMTKYAKSIR